MQQATVFVIDDDRSVRQAVSRLIQSVGLEAKSFGSAQEFLSFSLPDHPSCLVLEVRLPGLSGLELQREVMKRGRPLPAVFITDHGDVPTCVRAMKAGAVDFLLKPFHEQELLDSIHLALAGDHRARRRQQLRGEIERRLKRLTTREREVLEMVVGGLANKNIAFHLGITEKTVKVHRGQVMRKMEADSLADLVRLAERVNIVSPTLLNV